MKIVTENLRIDIGSKYTCLQQKIQKEHKFGFIYFLPT